MLRPYDIKEYFMMFLQRCANMSFNKSEYYLIMNPSKGKRFMIEKRANTMEGAYMWLMASTFLYEKLLLR